jgi:hypothetical protein
MKIRPDQKITVVNVWEDRKKRLNGVKMAVRKLADIAVIA